jgi:hypothetical protein
MHCVIFTLLIVGTTGLAADRDLIPSQLPKDQRDNLLRFMERQPKPDRFVPKDAKIVDAPADNPNLNVEPKPGQSIKQYTVQIVSHRPVPGQENPKRVDVLYYRPHPEKGKQGITIKQTVDVTTGEQVGQTEVLVKQHTPISREELTEAVAFAKENSTDVKTFYENHEAEGVRWEYLQMKINRKNEQHEPGDRVVRLVYSATPPEGQAAPTPVRVVVNLTKGIVAKDER